jgi:hypothetical protein
MFDNITSTCDNVYSEKTNEVAMMKNKNTIARLLAEEDTPLGRGRIENVRTKVGIDLEVMVKIPNIDGFTLFSGLELFEFDA